MTHVLLPHDMPQPRLVFFLAMEEYLSSRSVSEEDWFFLWQTRPTVIVGRNQDLEAEVNLPWCREHQVEVYRRKSGGGCVYSDEGNLMLSAIVRDTNAQRAFQDCLDRLVGVLQAMGLPAVRSEHNDVMVGDRKVSGNACFARPDATIVHGTLLWKSNMDHLLQAITPSEAKLRKHGVQSVRQRVQNLYDLGLTDVEVVKQQLISSLCSAERVLTSDEISAISRIEAEYLDPEFILRSR